MVTAAGQGIGRASAIALATEGAKVIATDLSSELINTLSQDYPQIVTHTLDVTDKAAIASLAEQYPELDGLFNVAGFVHEGTIMDASSDDWDFSFNLNVKSMYMMVQAFMPALQKQAAKNGTASILNMSSMASSIKGFPKRTLYGATKAAVLGLTKAIAVDFVVEGIRCNALCPGTVDTPSLRGRINSAADPVQAEKDFISRQPMGRVATVEDMTPMVVYLLSDESSFVTGQGMLVDGGVTI
ncbi:SDR family oxidoreductase [Leucothrix arctica]|uniref:NAD(P)-dependent oxidoreductase n=1 Tax=Leucothrix arctica TaxID=1481894 RepID=A0A317C844_9GAMM|nr:SDR family oxidoreductase [Leucothrix arctica]PWQ94441.1 NAD(P)-dependent oxidoreductase [Leucothrix arctica]